MAQLKLSTLSLEYVYVTVRADLDPTTGTPEMAFTAGGRNPAAGDWVTGAWVGTAVTVPGGLWECEARVLVGPGGAVALEQGSYACWVRLTGAPTVPVETFGTLRVT